MTALTEALARLRRDLVEEALRQPGSVLAYGRPHEHPRARWFPRYSPTGERLVGAERIGPDCPRPVRGRCECPPDGSWRPIGGVVRADATAAHGRFVPADTPVVAPAALCLGGVWVDELYEQGADGLWRCRWPVRRALERLRGESPARWAIAVRLLHGTPLCSAWGSHGAPPDPAGEAVRLLALIERRAVQERESEYERRPRQWWDPPPRPRDPNGRPIAKSEAQCDAEHAANGNLAADRVDIAATMRSIGSPRSTASDAALEQPSGQPGARLLSGIAIPSLMREEPACA